MSNPGPNATDAFVDHIAAAVVARIQPLLDQLTRPEPAPALLTRTQLAKQLNCSIAKIDRLSNDGMPFVRLGDVKRFRLEAVLAWLEGRTHDSGRHHPAPAPDHPPCTPATATSSAGDGASG